MQKRDTSGRNRRNESFVLGGGTLILGQDQDLYDANNFEVVQAYRFFCLQLCFSFYRVI